MKQRIQFKKTPPKDYTTNGNFLVCRGIPIHEFCNPKAAKLAAERWNAKHENNLQCQ